MCLNVYFRKVICICSYESIFQTYLRSPCRHCGAGILHQGNHPPSFENGKVNPASEGSRVIAVSFGKQQTKTTLGGDGLQPKISPNDSILISNGEDLDTCKVKIDDKTGEATISTDLTGPLTAAYPAKFAKIKDGEFDGFDIPAMQSGKFSDANLCYAEMEGKDESSLNFMNCCPVLKFYVDTSIGVKSIKITSSTEHIASKSMTITVKAPEGKTLYDVMPSEGQDRRICYVALDGKDVHSTELKFETETTTQGPVTRTPTKNILLKEGYMYNAFIPYYIEVNGQKWAYCNIGAFLPEDYGDYFMWAEVAGHKADLSIEPDEDGYIEGAFTFPETNPDGSRYHTSWDASKGFELENAPYYAGAKEFSEKYKNTGDILQAEDDAAAVNWGGGWRMPTKAEFETLLTGTGTSIDDIGEKYLSIKGTNLKLPVAGTGDNLDLDLYNESGYWSSSSGKTSLPNFQFNLRGCSLRFISGEYACLEMDEEYSPRQMGMPIRPIYAGPAPAPEKPTSLSGVFTVGEGKAVRFSRGNLYWDGTSSPGAYKFETEQYNYRLYPGKTSDYAFLDKSTVTPENTVGSFWWIKNGETADTPYSPEYNIEQASCSGNDILFTNATAVTPNADFTVNGDKGVWRALSGGSGGEWEYLLEKRTGAAGKVGTATVNGVTGTILLPDTFTDPSVNSASGGSAFVPLASEPENMDFGDNIYDLDSWKKMESEGAVFLPAAGHLQAGVDGNKTTCQYWSSSAFSSTESYSIMIRLENIDSYRQKSFNSSVKSPRNTLRISVRLVTDAPVAGSTVDDLNVLTDDSDKWQK